MGIYSARQLLHFVAPCWELKGLAVDLKNGTTVTGYTRWNKEAVSDAGYKGQFPEVLFEMPANAIDLYTDLEKVVYPIQEALVTKKEPLLIPAGEIIRLLAKPGPHDGYRGAGNIPLVSPKIATLLHTKPNALCEGDEGGVISFYWLAYNERISQEDLLWLCKYPLGRYNKKRR